MLTVTGRVYVLETGAGVPGLHVKAVDKDLIYDDVLGAVVSDGDGRFEITYEKKDFAELFEKAPDLYVIVRDAKGERILYSSEKNVRWHAGTREEVNIPLSQTLLGDAGETAIAYGPSPGRISVRLATPDGAALPETVKLFFTEHRATLRKQHVFTCPSDRDVTVSLPPGEYTMQVSARGFETGRGLAVVDPRSPSTLDVEMTPRHTRRSTFGERLARYGIDLQNTKIRSLDVAPGSRVVLDAKADRAGVDSRELRATRIAQIKHWMGSDDKRFGHDRPVFGPLPDRQRVARLAEKGRESKRLTLDETDAMQRIAREYIDGNSQSVEQFAPVLDWLLAASQLEQFVLLPIFFYTVVTIGAGATLVVGAGSSIFTCDELRIHKTGKLHPVGSMKIEIGTYREFG